MYLNPSLKIHELLLGGKIIENTFSILYDRLRMLIIICKNEKNDFIDHQFFACCRISILINMRLGEKGEKFLARIFLNLGLLGETNQESAPLTKTRFLYHFEATIFLQICHFKLRLWRQYLVQGNRNLSS